MITTNSRFATVAMGVLAMLYVSGCKESGSQSSSEEQRFHSYNINAYPLNKVVCDPMGGGGNPAPKQGIKAELYYRSASQPAYSLARDYIDHATKAEQNLFFTEMFVPTRLFDKGFTTQTSGVLKDDSGQTLIEYFGLKMNTTIRLAPNDVEGVYEFALLSDDGSVMKIKNNDNWNEVISNDGVHASRLGCSSQKIAMTRSTELETEVIYYQGPRHHISNILLWRKLTDAQAAGKDKDCGSTGNEYWFNPNTSQPTSKFTDLFNRGWNVVSQGNFYLPKESTESTQYNPCTSGNEPTISNVRIVEMVSSDIWVAWSTDIPATAQLMITNVATGDTLITETNNALNTQHAVHYSGLQTQTQYQLRVINVSEDLGRTVGGVIDFTTP